jgi:hypothetical protein
LPVDQSEDQVDRGEHARSVGDDDDDTVALADAADSLRECQFSLHVEIGVGLIEDDEKRIPVERASQPNSLSVTRRQGLATFADRGFITVGQSQNEVVHAGGLRRGNNGLGRGIGFEPGDILGHGPIA